MTQQSSDPPRLFVHVPSRRGTLRPGLSTWLEEIIPTWKGDPLREREEGLERRSPSGHQRPSHVVKSRTWSTMPLHVISYETQQRNINLCMEIHPDDIARRGGWAGVGAGTGGGTGIVRVRVRIRTGTERPDFGNVSFIGTVEAYK